MEEKREEECPIFRGFIYFLAALSLSLALPYILIFVANYVQEPVILEQLEFLFFVILIQTVEMEQGRD